jgi:HPt (histidine-containing phosphotransfer) domain-containing protein
VTDILDTQVLDELLTLSAGGDHDLMADLVNMFLEDAPAKLAEVVEGLQAQDWTKVERAAHALKGTSGSLGAHLVMADCEQIQNACRTRQHASVPGRVQSLRRNLEDADGALRRFIARLA